MEGEAPRVESTRKASVARDRDPGAGELRQAWTRRSEVAVQATSATAAAAKGRGWKRMRRDRRRRAEGSAARSATSEGRRSAETQGVSRPSPVREPHAVESERTCWTRRRAKAPGSGAGRDDRAQARPRLPRRRSIAAISCFASGEGAAASAPASSAASAAASPSDERWRRRSWGARRDGGFMV